MAIGFTAGSVALAIYVNVALGIVALLISGFFGFHFVRLFVNTIKSHVRLTNDELICKTPMGKESRIAWSNITHAGSYRSFEGEKDLFVYAEGDDRLLAIPDQYENIDQLEAEIADRISVDLLSLEGAESEDLSDLLREIVAPEEEIIDDD